MVGTNENGVPNERSASILGQYLGSLAESQTFAPLHIARWDNRLFDTYKEQIIKDAEEKFIFPLQTIQLTRVWILRTINNRWRAYKSKLKKQYFNREERTLEQIIQGRPITVNEHQWRALVGIWCQETHKELCAKNSQCAKLEKNTHTTGRKSHARLKKEMEDKKKKKVHRIELWDAAHKKKNGRYSNNKVKTVMDESFEELKRRKEHNNGNLSGKDFNDVFNDVVSTQLQACGYYGDKYWSQVKVSKDITFVNRSEEKRMYQDKVNAMENKMQHMNGVMKQWFAFMTRKFPEEDWVNEMGTEVNDGVDHINTEENTNAHHDYSEDINDVCDNEIHMNHDFNDDVTSPNHVQGAHVQDIHRDSENFCQTSICTEETVIKEAHIEKHGQVKNDSAGATLPLDSTMTSMGTRRVKAPEQNGHASQREVYLLSMMYKNRFVAKGKLVTTDSKQAIGESMLGSEFVGVYVDALVNAANGNYRDEELPRPLYEVKTLRDAIDYVIAWPRSHHVGAK